MLPLAKLAVPACAAAALLLVGRHRRHRRELDAKETSPVGKEACGCCAGGSFPTRPARDPTPRRALIGDLSRMGVGMSKDPTATCKRDCYIDWHDYFMSVAVLSAFRSKDPNRQVGACIVDPSTLRIVGIGYNGLPIGISDDALPWARAADSWLDTKYPYVCHAEVNAILNKNCESLKGCRLYVTLHPCNECAKLIIQSRISEVIYFSDAHKGEDAMKASRKMLQLAGVTTRQHRPAMPRIVLDFEQMAEGEPKQ
eukprot:6535452-Prymnesium_polylepis.1